nr:hypothetical protein HJG63_007458 [Rousettus aegyptiacus]
MAKQVQARRLDGIGQNLWLEFAELASKNDVVNLGQGFPNFPPPDFVLEAFQHAISGDFMLNQYTMGFGYPPLTNILASFFGKLLGQEIDPLKNVLVTVGAYGALFTAFQALVDEGDEVILIEPFFDCYKPMTLMAGGRPVFVSLKPTPTQDGELDSSNNWRLDPEELASKFTSRTKALVLNTPNNPLGKVPGRPPSEDPSRLGSSTPSVTDLLPSGLSFFICEVGGLPAMSSEDRGSPRSQGQAQRSSGKGWRWVRLGAATTDFPTGQRLHLPECHANTTKPMRRETQSSSCVYPVPSRDFLLRVSRPLT